MNKNWIGIAVLSLGLNGGCSLAAFENTSCEKLNDCQKDFGLGFVCAESGFCEKSQNPKMEARCNRTYPEDLLTNRELQKDRIIFGSLSVQSDDWDLAIQRGAETAMGIVERRNGANGKFFGAVYCSIEDDYLNDGIESSDAVIAVGRYLIDTYGIKAIQGPNYSGLTGLLFDELKNKADNVVIVSGGATAVSLTSKDPDASDSKPGLLWRTSAPDLDAPIAIAKDLETRTNKILILNLESAYSEGLADGVETAFLSTAVDTDNNNVVVDRVSFDDSVESRDAAFSAVSARAAEYEELVFLNNITAHQEVFIAQANNLFPDKIISGADFAADLVYYKAITDVSLLGRIRGARPKRPTTLAYKSFLTAFNSRFPSAGTAGTNQPFSQNGFDSAWLIMAGYTWAMFQEKEVNGTTIAKGLRKISLNQPNDKTNFVAAEWSKLVAAFESGKGIDAVGASGELTYDPVTEETTADIEIWELCKDPDNNNVVMEGIDEEISCVTPSAVLGQSN